MAVTDKTVVVDGQVYYNGDEIPDIGSWVAVSANGNIRNYNGLSADVSKLPHYVDTGSSALLYDGAGTTKVCHFLSGQWYEL